jgi:hypothetical protein
MRNSRAYIPSDRQWHAPGRRDMRCADAGKSSVVRVAGAGLLACGFFWVCGCAQESSTPSSSMYDRQQQALHDPFGYNPNLKKSDMSVSGNGEFDKQGLQRDVNDVLNP